MTDELETVSTYANLMEAEFAKSILELAGIESYIHAPHANALYPGVLGEIKLQVRAANLQEAKRVLDEGPDRVKEEEIVNDEH